MSNPASGSMLPPELERHIFELAAWNDRKAISILCLVAARVHIWIGPLRYRVVLIRDVRVLEKVLQGLSASPAVGEQIKFLAVNVPSYADVSRVLNYLPNVLDLGLWHGHSAASNLPQLARLSSLRRLSVNLGELLEQWTVDGSALSGLACLTHLETFGKVSPEMVAAIRAPPALTHLSFYAIYAQDIIKQVLHVGGHQLRLVVVTHLDEDQITLPDTEDTISPAAAQRQIEDPRFAVVLCKDFVKDWVSGVWYGVDYWQRAEEIVAARAQAVKGL
ncbi:hypothetical protein MIND_00586600 [Mycena indigotica]|uniref:Uncharacterized protein n=1 Tax=Mycena indigotica TaxID=2126181 RepID=A0A8H6W6M5_9AGAR|nr:uncharacterized protein MIND_00586600 [Mycena indigotica]KAF7303573.1 hypothetical protein MIND_00586600 [Mycena indigotica]